LNNNGVEEFFESTEAGVKPELGKVRTNGGGE
jgi:hypothetical protein